MSIENSAREIEYYVEESREAGVLHELLVEVLASFGNDYDAVAAAFFLAYQAKNYGGVKVIPWKQT